MTTIRTQRQLEAHQKGFNAAMRIFELCGEFPGAEATSLTGQIRRSFRSTCANLAEAWRKRRCHGPFVAKVSGVEAQAAETQVRLEFAVHRGYVPRAPAHQLYREFDSFLRTTVGMTDHPRTWLSGRDRGR